VRAKAVAVFPGGFGTLDEFFECLTLIQTGRMEKIPLVLFGEKFWKSIINFDALAEFGTIAPDDVKLISFVETAEEAWKIVQDFYERHEEGRSGAGNGPSSACRHLLPARGAKGVCRAVFSSLDRRL
jgi:predicted Rossmann-fold nucleotide-binding protein